MREKGQIKKSDIDSRFLNKRCSFANLQRLARELKTNAESLEIEILENVAYIYNDDEAVIVNSHMGKIKEILI